MAYKRQRSTGTWEFVIKRQGLLPKPIQLSFDSEQEGEVYVAHLERLLDAGIVPEEFQNNKKETITSISQAIFAYIKAVHITDDDDIILGALNKQIGSRTLDKVIYPWAEAWVKSLQDEGGAPSTIRKKVGALARCLDWVVRRADTMLVANPLRILPKRYATTATGRKDVERDRRLLDGEEMRIRSVLAGEKPKDRERAFKLPYADATALMFTIAIETAMRMREIYTITRDQVDLPGRTIFLDVTKNGDKRQVPLSSVAAAALSVYLSGYDGEIVFPFWDGKLTAPALRLASHRMTAQWRCIFDAAQCKGLRFHDLRHEATSRFFERTTMSDIEIAKVTGHSSTKMLMRYANLRGSNLASKLW